MLLPAWKLKEAEVGTWNIAGFPLTQFCENLRAGVTFPCTRNLIFWENRLDLKSGPGAIAERT